MLVLVWKKGVVKLQHNIKSLVAYNSIAANLGDYEFY